MPANTYLRASSSTANSCWDNSKLKMVKFGSLSPEEQVRYVVEQWYHGLHLTCGDERQFQVINTRIIWVNGPTLHSQETAAFLLPLLHSRFWIVTVCERICHWNMRHSQFVFIYDDSELLRVKTCFGFRWPASRSHERSADGKANLRAPVSTADVATARRRVALGAMRRFKCQWLAAKAYVNVVGDRCK